MRTILDLRGLVILSLNRGSDADSTKTPHGSKLNTVGHCLENFINDYILPALENSRLNEIIAVKEGGNKYRSTIYPEYKANRKKVAADPVKAESDAMISARVAECQSAVEDLLKGLGIPAVHVPTVEADDVIGYLAKYLQGPKLIHTVDQDLIQLANSQVGVFLKGTPALTYPLYNTATPKAKLLDIQPRHVALCKSIVGDSSDNYSGVIGLGPKSFLELHTAFGEDGLDELVEIVTESDFNVRLRQVVEHTGDKNLQKLYDNTQAWSTGWKLANINPDLVEARDGNKFNRLQWVKRVPDRERVNRVLESFGCKHLTFKLAKFLPTQTLFTRDNWNDQDHINWIRAEMDKSPFIALDWETSDELQHKPFRDATKGREFVDMLSSTITGAGFTFGANLEHTIYMSFDHADTNNLSRDHLLEVVDAIPEDKLTCIQNTLFEINLLKNTTGFTIQNTVDTKVMSSYVDENQPNGLKENSKLHLNYDQIKYSDVIEKGKRMKDYSADHVFKYGADDPLVTAHLFDHFKMIMELEGTYNFFLENENLPIEILSDGFLAGVSMDWEELDRQAAEDRADFAAAMAEVRRLLSENQDPITFSQGVDRLFEEMKDEVEAKAILKFESKKSAYEIAKKAFEACEGRDETGKEIKPPVEPTLNQMVSDALEDLGEKLRKAVKYEDFRKEEKPKEFELTPTCLNPILDKLGIPRLTTEYVEQFGAKDPASFLKGTKPKGCAIQPVKAWVDKLRDSDEYSPTVVGFLDSLFLAVPHNDPSEKKTMHGEGRAHPQYQSFRTQAMQYIDPIYETKGSELNLGSPQQMQTLLYGMLDLPIRLRGFEVSETREKLGLDKASPQANEDAIRVAVAEDCKEAPWKKEALENILKAKKCQTRLSLFYDVYPLWKHPVDGLIHPQVNSCGTETRRPTGSSPNPLQWPKRGDGVKFRRCILPNQKLGHDVIVSLDWNQAELRIAGGLSMDEVFLDCYVGNDVEKAISEQVRSALGDKLLERFLATGTKDIHTQTAALGLMGRPFEEVSLAAKDESHPLHKEVKKYRTAAKSVNFGGLYDIGRNKLSRQLLCTADEAAKYLEDKKSTYWKFEEFRAATIALAERQGYVTTKLGNRRHVHDGVLLSDQGQRSAIFRQVVNFLIQGLAADMLKRTLTGIYKSGVLERTGAVLIAPIYDEVVFSAHSSKVEDLILTVHSIMTQDVEGLPVPILAEPSLGLNFGDQIEIGWDPTPEKIQEALDKAFNPSTTKYAEAA